MSSACSINPANVIKEADKIIADYKLGQAINVKNTSDGKFNQTVYGQAKEGLNSLQDKLFSLENYVKGGCSTSMSSLTTMGTLQDDILRLKKEIEEKTHDVDVAKSRHDAVAHGKKDTSTYQGIGAKMGFVAPLHKSSVAVLIGLAIFLILTSVYVAKGLFDKGSSINTMYNAANSGSILGSFDTKAFMLGVVMVAVVVGIASFFGLYGKSVQ